MTTSYNKISKKILDVFIKTYFLPMKYQAIKKIIERKELKIILIYKDFMR